MTAQTLVQDIPANVPQDRIVSFDMFSPFDLEDDFHRSWVRLREDHAHELIWTPHNEGHWIALSPSLIGDVYADSTRFSSRIVLVPKSTAGEAYSDFIPLSLDPPVHRPFRKLLNDKLYGASINHLEEDIRALTVSLIEAFLHEGSCNFVHQFAEELPLRVFMQMVDLPVSDLPRLKQLADQFTRPDGSLTPEEANIAFREYLVPVLRDRKGSGRSDLLTHIAEGMVDGRPITDDEAAKLASQAMVGGLDTVVNFMGFTMLTLARLPDVQQRIASDFSVIPAVTNELLRRLPLVSSAREVVADIIVDGVTLKAGDMVVAPTTIFALDPKSGEKLMDFDIDRPNKQHAAFGTGPHTCPGQFLARMEMKVLLEEWFKRIPSFRLVPGQTIAHLGGTVGGTAPYVLEWDQ